ncbi:AAA family ATPase [Candidatus Peregrinibacteria bacterium]|nr:AAA family ATPase [Candidatus Peregrinibacteria bacterium]
MTNPKFTSSEPLAHLLRPKTLTEFAGQEEVVSEGKMLQKLIESDQLNNMIFWGPPGVGKTTLAQIIAEQTKSNFKTLSAVTSGVADLRKIIQEAEEMKRLGTPTILFIDEIHRFNKAQQDALLPHTERGTITLIGATTENPSFEVNSALLSRSQVFVFKSLTEQDLEKILDRALDQVTDQKLTKQAKSFLTHHANGDARTLLNTLEVVLKISKSKKIDEPEIKAILQKKFLRYDKKGEEHYNIISALHKSLRDSDPDGALYWMMRMLEAGEDPKYVARRLVRFASEDIGMADPHALLVAIAAKDAVLFNGMPECEVNLAQACIHLAMAPKSNASYKAVNAVKSEIKSTGNLEVPLHIRNAPTKLMKELDYGKGYKYAHDYEDAKVNQQHLPDELKGKRYYFPTERGIEAKIKERLDN